MSASEPVSERQVSVARSHLLPDEDGAQRDIDLTDLVRNVDDLDFTPLSNTSPSGRVDEGLVCTVISRELGGSDDICVSWGRILPGQHHLCHHHPDASEFYVILEGRPLVWLGSRTFRARPGDSVYIPRGLMHGLTNDGDVEVRMLVGMSKPADWEFIFDE